MIEKLFVFVKNSSYSNKVIITIEQCCLKKWDFLYNNLKGFYFHILFNFLVSKVFMSFRCKFFQLVFLKEKYSIIQSDRNEVFSLSNKYLLPVIISFIFNFIVVKHFTRKYVYTFIWGKFFSII